jgi:hypothetical protein
MTVRRIAALVTVTASAALGATLLVAPTAHAQGSAHPSVQPAAKVKCVGKATGYARYAKSGACKRSERVDRKPCAKGGSCVVGDIGPGGGRVFYSSRTQQPWGRYLEVAPRSWNPANPDALVTWCSDVTTSLPGTQGTGLGDGKANTAAMAAACGPDTAAVLAAAYRGGGQADWYLASRDELRALFRRQRLAPPFELRGYWSSSEATANTAWIQDFYAAGGYPPAPSDKSLFNCVRPIRAF